MQIGFIRFVLLTAVFTVFFPPVSAQTPANDRPRLNIPKLQRAPLLEDFLEMKPGPEIEGQMAKAENFIQNQPRDGEPASQRTEAYLGYDDKHLYVVFVAFDKEPNKIRARLSKREDAFDDDFVEVTLDTFHDRRRGYVFWSNPLGVQAEGIWTEAEGSPDFSFDTVWQSRGQLTKEGFVVWMAIPFKSLRFSADNQQTWSITLLRQIPRVNEWSYWPRISSRIEGRLSQAGDVTGLRGISPGRNILLIPYATFRSFKVLDAEKQPPGFTRDRQFDGGLDAKIVLKDNFVLDVTANPDFAQVESDQPQVTVNQRFEVFFPERRPFFLENSDFFRTPINLVFTRRIADPQFGARLTGKARGFSIGAMLIDDQAPGRGLEPNDPFTDKRARFGIIRVNRDIFKQSSIGVTYTDREFAGAYNRVGGIDGRFKLSSNWVALFQGVTSATKTTDGSYYAGPAYEFSLYRQGRQFNTSFQYSDRSPNFITETGFNRRSDIRTVRQEYEYQFRPEGKFLISWGPGGFVERTWDHEGTRLDWLSMVAMRAELIGNTRVNVFNILNRERLRPKDYSVLTENKDFYSGIKGVFLQTRYFRQVTINGEYSQWTGINYVPPSGQEPFYADKSQASVGFTVKPMTRLSVDNTWLMSRMLDRYSGANIFNNHIIRSKWNWQFSRALSLRAIFQYDTLLANQKFTAIETRKNFNADLLLTYQLNPWTALYVGYNSNLQNLDLITTPRGTEVMRTTDRFINDGKQLFVKFSYLFRF